MERKERDREREREKEKMRYCRKTDRQRQTNRPIKTRGGGGVE